MNILFGFIVGLHILVCLFLIGVVLLQQGRSADLAGAFGGQGSQTAFGPRAAANVLTRLTTWSAIIFYVTSISLTILYQRQPAHTPCWRTRSPRRPQHRQVRQVDRKLFSPFRFATDGRPHGLPFLLIFRTCARAITNFVT